MTPNYEKNFSPDKKRTNSAMLHLEERNQKKFHSPYKNSKIDIKQKFLLEEEGKLDEPLS
jgi:hypothetical protein